MINYLFCLDENYNNQFLTTLCSLNENSTKKFNVFVIHKNPKNLKKYFLNSKSQFNLINEINFYQIDNLDFAFPNLENNHVSEATYYRFFIEKYLPTDIDSIVYLDCDIVCVNNPEDILSSALEELKDSNYIVGASTEYIKNKRTKEVFNRLNLNSNTYFNAGVMLIDYKKWIKESLMSKLLELMVDIRDDINFWDQDVLNKFIDGSYLELSNYLNFSLINEFSNNLSEISRKIVFIHYSGSSKPWTIKGINIKSSYYFHYYYHIHSDKYYFLTTNYKKGALFDLLKVLFSLKILTLNYPKKFLRVSLKVIFNNE